MDAPIYIHRAFYGKEVVSGVKLPIRNQLYVIEGRDGSAGEEVAETGRDRIRVYDLPDLDDLFYNSSFFVVGSRLFNVGSCPIFGGAMEDSYIQYVDYSHPNGRWEKSALDDFVCLDGIGVLDGDRISCFGAFRRDFSFLANDMKPRISSLSPLPCGVGIDSLGWQPTALAVTPGTTENQKIYVFWYSGGKYGVLGFYLRGEWQTIDAEAIWPGRSTNAVVVKDQFLITFSDCHPLDETERYAPELYVCDIRGSKSKWLDKPVEGLLHDDSGLPFLDRTFGFTHTSVMQVSEVNFALHWSMSGPIYSRPGQRPTYQLNCTKFTVSIKDEDTDPPTFRAQLLSSVFFSSDDITLCVNTVHSTTRNPSSLQETPSRNLPLKRKLQALQSADEDKVSSSEG